MAPFGALLLVAGCGGGDLTLPTQTTPTAIARVQGDGQTGTAGQPLADSLTVQVTDFEGNPVSGQRVAFVLGADVPGAEISPDTATTGSEGIAAARWVLGSTSGLQSVIARVVGLDQLAVTFEATVAAGGAARIEGVSGDAQSAPSSTSLSDSLVVRVLDGPGNPVAGVTVEWSAAQGSVNPASVVTGPDGRAATFRILGPTTGTQTTTATSAGLVGSPVTFTSTAVAGGTDRLVKVSGDNQRAPARSELPNPLVVRLVDGGGNGIPNRAVTWLVGVGGGSVSSGTSNTDGQGEATVRWTLGSGAVTNTLNAVVSGVGVIGFTAVATGGGGGGGAAPARIAFKVQPSDTKKRDRISPAVEVVVLDQGGHQVTSGDLEIKLELTGDGDGNLKGHKSQRTHSGVATFSDLKVDKEGDYRLRATADGVPSVESDGFHVRGDHGD